MKKKMFKITKRIFIGILTLLLTLIIAGFIYEQTARSLSEKKYQPSGEFIDVGGHQLHYLKKGNGGPTVIFESGWGAIGHLPWYKVENEVSKFATTISYDRAGILWSERGDNPKTAEAIATELYTMLNNASFSKPYIVVGHSMAGITLRSFITKYQADISGIVFVDASPPDLENRCSPELKSYRQNNYSSALIKFMNSIGVVRLFSDFSYTWPNTERDDLINTIGNELAYKGYAASFEELDNLKQMKNTAKSSTSFGDIPLIVITANRSNEIDNKKLDKEFSGLWSELQMELLGLSTRSEQVLASCGHAVPLDQPEVIVKAIKKLVNNGL